MTTSWIHRLHIIIPANERAAANAIAADIDPDTGGAFTFGPPSLSATGSAPATHCLTNTAATESMVQAMLYALGTSGLQVMYWRLDLVDVLVDSNVSALPEPETATDEDGNEYLLPVPRWTVVDTLAAAGLQLIQTGG